MNRNSAMTKSFCHVLSTCYFFRGKLPMTSSRINGKCHSSIFQSWGTSSTFWQKNDDVDETRHISITRCPRGNKDAHVTVTDWRRVFANASWLELFSYLTAMQCCLTVSGSITGNRLMWTLARPRTYSVRNREQNFMADFYARFLRF